MLCKSLKDNEGSICHCFSRAVFPRTWRIVYSLLKYTANINQPLRGQRIIKLTIYAPSSVSCCLVRTFQAVY